MWFRETRIKSESSCAIPWPHELYLCLPDLTKMMSRICPYQIWNDNIEYTVSVNNSRRNLFLSILNSVHNLINIWTRYNLIHNTNIQYAFFRLIPQIYWIIYSEHTRIIISSFWNQEPYNSSDQSNQYLQKIITIV